MPYGKNAGRTTLTRGPIKRCPQCKRDMPATEKMWCWICARCSHIVEYKPGTLLDVKLKLEEKLNATQSRNEP